MIERRRIRQRKPELQLQAALNDAEELSRAAPTPENVERMRLIKARLAVLKARVAQKLRTEVVELTRRVGELVAENARLRQELAGRTRRTDPEIESALARYQEEKSNGITNAKPRTTADEEETVVSAR